MYREWRTQLIKRKLLSGCTTYLDMSRQAPRDMKVDFGLGGLIHGRS